MRKPRFFPIKFNINAAHDWQSDLNICINALTSIALFFITLGIVILALFPIYRIIAGAAEPHHVYTYEDWAVALNDPFIDTVILHTDLDLSTLDLPDRDIRIIKE